MNHTVCVFSLTIISEMHLHSCGWLKFTFTFQRWFHRVNIPQLIFSVLDGCLEFSQFLVLMNNAVCVGICANSRKRPLWMKSSGRWAQLDTAVSGFEEDLIIQPVKCDHVLPSVGQHCFAVWEKQTYEDSCGMRECLRNWKQGTFSSWAGLGRKGGLWGGGSRGRRGGQVTCASCCLCPAGSTRTSWPRAVLGDSL